MYVKELQVRDFRNWSDEIVALSDGLNIFEGRNAQGKTNLLEAVYLTCVGKSMRTPRDRELIRWEKDRAYVRTEVVKRGGGEKVEVVLDKSVGKCVSVNGLPLTRLGELMGVVLAVLFSPEEIKIVKESPSERRRFADIALSQLSKGYFYRLNRYNRTLAQRNKLLKSGSPDRNVLDVWDMQLVEAGSGIVKSRRGFLDRLTPIAERVHAFLTDGKEKLSLSYEGAKGDTLDEIKENFASMLAKSREHDLRTGFTHVGPHKDDIAISADGVDMRTFGSQGQQRTAALSLQLSLPELMSDFTGEKPVLLLDDVMSELDEVRRLRLVEFIAPYQTIVTCTDLQELASAKNVARYRIEHGSLV